MTKVLVNNMYDQSAGTPGPPGEKGDKGDTGEQGIPGVQGIQGTPGAVGPAGLLWRGVYNADTHYVKDDAVSYVGTNGKASSYFALQPTIDNEPAEGASTDYWAMLAQEGAQGPQGVPGDPASNLVTSVNGQQGPVSITPQNIGAATAADLNNVFNVAMESTARARLALLPSYAPNMVGVFNNERSVYNLKPSNTRRWRKGMGIAATGGYHNEVWIGDSILGGCIDVTAGTFDRLNAVAPQYSRLLAARMGIPLAGPGYIRAQDGGRRDSRVTTNGAGSQSCVGLTVGQTVVVTPGFAGDTINVMYYDNGATGTPAFSISVDGATTGANFKAVNYAATDSKWKSAVMTGVTMTAASTITVTSTRVSSVCYISAVEAYKSGGGIRVHNVCQSGTAASTWDNNGSGFDPIRPWSDNALPFIPDVVHFGVGLFDYDGTRTANDQRDSIIAIRAKFPNSDFVIHADPVPISLTEAQWLPFVTGAFMAADVLDVPLLDLQNLLGGATVEAALGLTGDTTAHLKKEAYGIWARATAQMGQ